MCAPIPLTARPSSKATADVADILFNLTRSRAAGRQSGLWPMGLLARALHPSVPSLRRLASGPPSRWPMLGTLGSVWGIRSWTRMAQLRALSAHFGAGFRLTHPRAG